MFSNKLKELRIQKNITQEELGKQFNVTKTAVSNWESGNRFPDESTILQIADYFNVSLDELLDRYNCNTNTKFFTTSSFAERIKELRLSNELTQNEMGLFINKSEATINCYEKGTREPNRAEDYVYIAQKFGVSTDWLLGVEKCFTYDIELLIKLSKELSEEQVKLLISIAKNFK